MVQIIDTEFASKRELNRALQRIKWGGLTSDWSSNRAIYDQEARVVDESFHTQQRH